MEKDYLLKRENLTNRLNNLVLIYTSSKDSEYPKSLVMYDYGNLNLISREELLFKIKELCNILQVDLELKGSDK